MMFGSGEPCPQPDDMISRSQILSAVFAAVFGLLAFHSGRYNIREFMDLTHQETRAAKAGLTILCGFCVAWFLVATLRQVMENRK